MNSYNSIDTIISQAFINMDYNKALNLYLECLHSILYKILTYTEEKNINMNENIIDLINNETDIHSIIINAIYILKEQSITRSNITINSKKITKKNIATLHDIDDISQFTETMKPWLYINCNFKYFLIKIIDLNINDLLNNRMCLITIKKWNDIYNNIIKNYQGIGNNLYSINTIWYQQLRIINFLYLLLSNNSNFSENDIKQKELNDELGKKIIEKDENIKTMENINSNITKENIKLIEENDNLNKKNIKLKYENTNYEQDINKYKQDIKQINDKLEESNKENQILSNKYQNEIKEMNDKLQKINQRNEYLSKNYEETKQTHNTLQETIKNLSHNYDREIRQMNNKLQETNEENKQYQSNLDLQYSNNYKSLETECYKYKNLCENYNEILNNIKRIIEIETKQDIKMEEENKFMDKHICNLIQNKNEIYKNLMENFNDEKKKFNDLYVSIQKIIKHEEVTDFDIENKKEKLSLNERIFNLLQNKNTQIFNLKQSIENINIENQDKITEINKDKFIKIKNYMKDNNDLSITLENTKQYYLNLIKNKDRANTELKTMNNELQIQLNEYKIKLEEFCESKKLKIGRMDEKIKIIMEKMKMFQKLVEKEEDDDVKMEKNDGYLKTDESMKMEEEEEGEYYWMDNINDLYDRMSQILELRKKHNLSLLQSKETEIKHLKEKLNSFKIKNKKLNKDLSENMIELDKNKQEINNMMDEMNDIQKLLKNEEKDDYNKMETKYSLYIHIEKILQNKEQNIQNLFHNIDKLDEENRKLMERMQSLTAQCKVRQTEINSYYHQLTNVKNKILSTISKSLFKEEKEEEKVISIQQIIDVIMTSLNSYEQTNLEKLNKMFEDIDNKEKSLNTMMENIKIIS